MVYVIQVCWQLASRITTDFYSKNKFEKFVHVVGYIIRIYHDALSPERQKLLTYSMVQSPSWEANWFAASQEIPRISRNPKVHFRSHKRLSTLSILGDPNPVHIPTSRLLEIHPNIIHPSTPRSPQWSLSLRFPHQDPIHPLSSHIRATCQPISFFSILSPAQYWVSSTNHLAPRYAIFSITPLPRPS